MKTIFDYFIEPILINSHRNNYKRRHAPFSLELHFLLFAAVVGSVLIVAKSILFLD